MLEFINACLVFKDENLTLTVMAKILVIIKNFLSLQNEHYTY